MVEQTPRNVGCNWRIIYTYLINYVYLVAIKEVQLQKFLDLSLPIKVKQSSYRPGVAQKVPES